MPRVSFHQQSVFGRSRFLAGGLLAAVAATCTLSGAGSASAADMRDVQLDLIDSDVPAAVRLAGDLVIDSSTDRGYLLDGASSDLLVYDLSGSTLVLLSTVALGTDAEDLAVDTASHLVLVTDPVDKTVSVVNGDPASPTAYTVLSTIATGGLGSDGIAIDSTSHTAYVANDISRDVSIIDIAAATATVVPIGITPNDITVDSTNGVAYVSSSADRAIMPIAGVTPGTPITPATTPVSLEFAAGRLLVGTESLAAPYDYRIDAYDTDLRLSATSRTLADLPTHISTDPSMQLTYVTQSDGSLVGLRSTDLTRDSLSLVPTAISSATVDSVSHRVFTVQTTRASTNLSMYALSASPVILQPLRSVGMVGAPFSFFVSSIAAPQANRFTLANGSLPPGLELDTTTGEIHGTPTAEGSLPFVSKCRTGSAGWQPAPSGSPSIPRHRCRRRSRRATP